MAAVLYSNEAGDQAGENQVEELARTDQVRKADILVQAVERKIVAENSSAPLKKFCQVLRRRHGVGSIVSRMKCRLGEWMR